VQLSILLLAADPISAEALSAALMRPGHGVTVVSLPEELVREAAGYSLIVIDEIPATATVDAIVAELRAEPRTAALPILAVAQTDDVEARIALLESGADDVITKPFDPAELEARVEALSLRFQRAQDGRSVANAPIGNPQARRVVTVFSPKGGVGTTTVATNLALLAAERHQNRALIIDFDLSFGQVASHLNLQPKQSLLELIRDEGALHDAELFRTYAVHHPSGVQVLAAPPSPGFAPLFTGEHAELIRDEGALHDAELFRTYAVHHPSGVQVLAAPPSPGFAPLFTGEHAELIIARALEAYEIVIIDAGAALDDRMLALFSRSDVVIIPVLPEIPALNSVHLLLDQLSETGAVGATTMFVLNNVFARDLLRRGDVESALGAKITADLPYDPFVYLKAANEGVPVVRSAPKTAPATQLRDLFGTVFGTDDAKASDGKEKKGLFGRRR
jgi:pilus assembly protein CpaE